MFQPHEKLIYSTPGSDAKFDPLAVLRHLEVETGGHLDRLLDDYQAAQPRDEGAILRPEDVPAARVTAARAEEALVAASRAVFGLPPFPASMDGTALEWLWDFLDWLEKKGRPGETRPTSPTPTGLSPQDVEALKMFEKTMEDRSPPRGLVTPPLYPSGSISHASVPVDSSNSPTPR